MLNPPSPSPKLHLCTYKNKWLHFHVTFRCIIYYNSNFFSISHDQVWTSSAGFTYSLWAQYHIKNVGPLISVYLYTTNFVCPLFVVASFKWAQCKCPIFSCINMALWTSLSLRFVIIVLFRSCEFLCRFSSCFYEISYCCQIDYL